MIETLKQINEELINKCQDNPELLKKQLLIKRILSEEKAFFKISIESSYSILRDLMIPEASIKDVYSKLIDINNFTDKEKFKYEKPTIQRKEEALEFIEEFKKNNSSINGMGGLQKYINDYEAWLEKLKSDELCEVSSERVPAKTYFLIRNSDNKIIGMVNIRLYLNESLKKHGGNIGYCIRPSERKKGYNIINMYMALKVCEHHNIKEVMLDCNEDNIASNKTIDHFRGTLIKEYFDHEINHDVMKMYIIDVQKALKNNQKCDEQITFIEW